MKRKSWLVVVVLLLSLVLTGGAIVWAQSEAPLEASAPQAQLRHCIAQAEVITAEPAEAGDQSLAPADVSSEEALVALAPSATCFATFEEAIAAASGGAARLPSGIAPENVTPEMLPAAPTAVIIGIDYQHSNFGGATFTWYATNSVGCYTGLSYYKSAAPSGWNNVISSARGFGGCNRFYHYESPSFLGAVLRCSPTCYSFGALNDHTSSWRWYRDGFHY